MRCLAARHEGLAINMPLFGKLAAILI